MLCASRPDPQVSVASTGEGTGVMALVKDTNTPSHPYTHKAVTAQKTTLKTFMFAFIHLHDFSTSREHIFSVG